VAIAAYPTEFLKTKVQLYQKYTKLGLWKSGVQTVAKEGARGLYRGLPVVVILATPKTAVRFFSKEYYE